jgi:hypothetical protein
MPWVSEEQTRINQKPTPTTPTPSHLIQANQDNQNGFYNKAKHNRTKKKQSNPNLIEQSEDVSIKALTLPTRYQPAAAVSPWMMQQPTHPVRSSFRRRHFPPATQPNPRQNDNDDNVT